MGERDGVRATYRIRVSAADLEERTRALILEQTAELPDDVVRAMGLGGDDLGRVVGTHPEGDGVHHVTVLWPEAAFDGEVATLLTVLFGNSSLVGDAIVVHVDVPEAMRRRFGGPRFGVAGLREGLGVPDRPLTCTALKPVGASVDDLADRARTFAAAGIDLIKDDHGIANQKAAPFEARVRACAEAVREGAERAGGTTLYCPSVTGGVDDVRRRIAFAREAGAGAVMIQPCTLGLPAFAEVVASDPGLPIVAHPAHAAASGYAPEAMLGRLFRLLGADAVIWPHSGGRFGWSDRTCARIAHGLTSPWEPLAPAFPVPAGGMHLDRVEELVRFYGRDVVLLVGGGLYRAGERLAERTREFVEVVRRAT